MNGNNGTESDDNQTDILMENKRCMSFSKILDKTEWLDKYSKY